MKKLSVITASLLVSAALATSAAAEEAETVTPLQNLEEPIIQAGETVIAPNPIELLSITSMYSNPNGDLLNSLAPQFVHPTGQVINDYWVEIYTWLGKAWIIVPNYTPDYN
ncbi:hypothetical protein [Paenibacillus lentus]|uniref:SH3 domain-containing protein n=1 Tax=Paenibacillus lentus TaxID=1338368 RepID=A0A3S8RT73_9BACL|nr:hypothetical protein [Paenibacillus lentus]AZK46159.1 hypothetical protein EIM92_08105 [Paenibacillus lentus]